MLFHVAALLQSWGCVKTNTNQQLVVRDMFNAEEWIQISHHHRILLDCQQRFEKFLTIDDYSTPNKKHLHPYADSNCWCRNVQPAGAWYAGDRWEFWAAPAALKVVTESLLVPMIRAIVDEQINQTKEEQMIWTFFRTFWWYTNHIVVNRLAILVNQKTFGPVGLFLVFLNTSRWIQW